jgi:hypothetical protein
MLIACGKGLWLAERIVQLIETAPGPIDAAYIQKMHGDDYNASAAFMVPVMQL